MPVWLIVLLSVLGGLIVLLFVGLLGLYLFSFYSPKKGQSDHYNLSSPIYRGVEEEVKPLIDSIVKIPYEDAYITSFDKLKLHARIYVQPDSKKVAVLCHGYRGTPYRDFSGGAVEVLKLGYNVVLIDERAHGMSEGHSITFGVREVRDAIDWVKYAKNRFGEDSELVLIGISMGGNIVLTASDKIGPAKIIADCPFSSPRIMLRQSVKELGLPVAIFYPLVNLASIVFTHTNLNKVSAYDSIKNTTNKILIIHGDADMVVPHFVSDDLYKAYPDKIQYELFHGANHGMSYIVDKPRYQKIIKDFLEN